MRLCDATMFWSAAGGGVRRYLEHKRAWLGGLPGDVSHLLVIPGAGSGLVTDGMLSTATVRSPSLFFSPGYRTPVSLGPALAFLEKWKPDLAEGGCPFRLRKALSVWSRDSGRPVFDYYHAFFPLSYTEALFGARRSALRSALEKAGWAYLRSVYADSRRVFVASPLVRDVLASRGIVNTELAPLGVDTGLFRPGAPREGDPVILFVGRLTREKGFDTVLEAFSILSRRRRAKLVVVGDGIMRERALEAARLYPGVSYLRFLDPGRLAGVYRDASVLLSAAPAETLGLTFLEALASGVPVVGLAGSGLMDTFPAEISRAVGQASPEALAEAVAGILDDPPDPAACRSHAEGYSWPGRLAHIAGRELALAGMEVPGWIGEMHE